MKLKERREDEMLAGVTVPGVAAGDSDGDGDALLPRWTKASMALAQFPMAGGRRGGRRQRLEKRRERPGVRRL